MLSTQHQISFAMQFEAGQKIVCINANWKGYCRYPLTKGAVYTVHSTYRCTCGSRQIALREYAAVLNVVCCCSQIITRRQTYYEWRFVPLDLFEEIIAIPKEKAEEKEVQIEQPESREK